MDEANQVSDPEAVEAPWGAEEHALRAKSFGAAATQYARFRPDYPLDAIAWLLGPVTDRVGDRAVDVLDLGAGTGKLTGQLAGQPIAGRQLTVVAVEPDPEMLAELRRQVPGVTALAGRAEEIPLPDGSVDAVLAGQAAHWFELGLAIPEMARVLRPGGVLGGLWNADDSRVPWVVGLHEASGRRTVMPVGEPEKDEEQELSWPGELAAGLFWPSEEAEFTHRQAKTADSLIATLGTHSAFLIMEPAERDAALDQVRDFLAATPETASGEFELPMLTLALRAIRR